MKKFFSKYEKAILLFFPSVAIVVGCLVLIPQLLKIFSSPRDLEYTAIPNIDQLTEVVDAQDLPDEINAGHQFAPEEAVPEAIDQPFEPETYYGWRESEDGKRTYLDRYGTPLHGLKYIDNNLFYFDENGICAERIGIDVSFYNGTINWRHLKEIGIDFALLRLGGRGWGQGGTLYDDSLFFNYLNGAKAAGLNVGVYFYSAAVNQLEAVQEASLVVQRLRGFSLEMPVYLDIEYSGNYPGGRADTLSMAKRMENIKAFCRTIENAGYSAGIYSSESFFTDELSLDALSRYDIWMASYTENNALPSQKVPYNIWQLTDRGRLPGISGTCDINVMF